MLLHFVPPSGSENVVIIPRCHGRLSARPFRLT